jgi:hypothetical protein
MLATLYGFLGGLVGLFGAIKWEELTGGLKSAFETGVTEVLPIAGIILAAFITFKAIRRFVKT